MMFAIGFIGAFASFWLGAYMERLEQPRELRLVLNDTDFADLVLGREVLKRCAGRNRRVQRVRMILSDIGFSRMIEHISIATMKTYAKEND